MQKCAPMLFLARIQKPKDNADTYNQDDPASHDSWENYESIRCSIRDAGGRERFTDDSTLATVNKVLTMWSTPKTRQVKATYRILYTDIDQVQHTLNVIHKKIDGKKVHVQCWEDDS